MGKWKGNSRFRKTTNRFFVDELSMSINELQAKNPVDLIENEKINSTNLEKIADILSVVAANTEKPVLAKKCIEIYEYTNITDKTYSIARIVQYSLHPLVRICCATATTSPQQRIQQLIIKILF